MVCSDPFAPAMSRPVAHFTAVPHSGAHRILLKSAWAGATLLWALGAGAQTGSIFTCVDAQGRRLTSDRPIAECMDREQRELNRSGTLRRVVRPEPTAAERAAEAARLKAEAEALARLNEQRRREQLLLNRYPNTEAHQRARADALHQIDDVMAAVHKRELELTQQRRAIEEELEFYRRDPSKAPEWLKRRQADNAQQRALQAQYLADQEREKARVNTHFDEELELLQRLWTQQQPPQTPSQR